MHLHLNSSVAVPQRVAHTTDATCPVRPNNSKTSTELVNLTANVRDHCTRWHIAGATQHINLKLHSNYKWWSES